MQVFKKILASPVTIGELLIVSLILLFSNCKESNPNHLSSTNDEPPKKVTDVKVKNFHGGADIHYKIPDDHDLLYVKAVWSTQNNKHKEAKTTYFKDSLRVDGFLTTSPHEVKLYSYSRGGNSSDPKTVTVNPLTPPVINVFQSIGISTAFGGVALSYQNPDTADVTITVLAKDSTGRFTPLQREYTSVKEDTFNVRGLDAEPQEFGYFVRDKFQNRSDTIYTTLAPLFETKLDQTKFSNARLPTDDYEAKNGAFDQRIWDDKVGRGPAAFFASSYKPFPFWITLDLGQKARLSRFVLHGRPHYGQFNHGYPKRFELWGSSDPNLNDGVAFDDSWFKYGTFVSHPPSGQEPATQQEIDAGYAGGADNFTIPNANSFPETRYLRIKFLQSYGHIKKINFTDIDVFGQPATNDK